MSEIFTVTGDISLTSDVVSAIRDGYEHVPGISDPVASIEFGTPVDRGKPGRWVISFFSKEYAPVEAIFRIQDVELALSLDAQDRLRGKVIDLIQGEIVIRDYGDADRRR